MPEAPAKRRRNVPEHLRRAIRLAISVGIAAATGFSLLGPLGGWHSRWGSQTMMGTKWAAITSVVCNAPVIAKTTEVALERVLGTVTGGLLGYGLAITNDVLPFLDQPIFTVVAATFVAFMSIILGYQLRLDYAGRLFIMTFILVVMAAPKKEDAFIVAVTRISGIIFGVITTMVMSVVVFPKSASHQATDNCQAGLAALARLNSVAWRRGMGCTAMRDIMQPPRVGEDAVPGGDGDLGDDARIGDDAATIRLLVDAAGAGHDMDACCDEALTEVYAKMSACQDFTAMSKSETYVFTSRGRWCLVPAFKCLPWRTALPDREMSRVVSASRKVARLLWCLHTSLPEVEDGIVLERNPGALSFLSNLGSSLQIYFENLAASFPNQQGLDASQLYHFIEGVETLIAASHRASRESTILLDTTWQNGKSRSVQRPSEDPPLPAHATGKAGSDDTAALPARGGPADGAAAYICEAGGLVTRVSGAGMAAPASPARPVPEAGRRAAGKAGFSPEAEVLQSGSHKDRVLRAAAEADARSTGDSHHSDSKDSYMSEVRWQATQFLLRRLARELISLNAAFVRLSALLPPTRWESRRRRQLRKAGIQEPLLHSDSA